MNAAHHRTVRVDGLDIFYREGGLLQAPKILLFRDLIALLSDRCHLLPSHDLLPAPAACQCHSPARGKDQPYHVATRSTACRRRLRRGTSAGGGGGLKVQKVENFSTSQRDIEEITR
jgi:hypothetical protein